MLIQYNAYDLFGMKIGELSYVAGVENPYLFDSKEWVADGLLDIMPKVKKYLELRGEHMKSI